MEKCFLSRKDSCEGNRAITEVLAGEYKKKEMNIKHITRKEYRT